MAIVDENKIGSRKDLFKADSADQKNVEWIVKQFPDFVYSASEKSKFWNQVKTEYGIKEGSSKSPYVHEVFLFFDGLNGFKGKDVNELSNKIKDSYIEKIKNYPIFDLGSISQVEITKPTNDPVIHLTVTGDFNPNNKNLLSGVNLQVYDMISQYVNSPIKNINGFKFSPQDTKINHDPLNYKNQTIKNTFFFNL